MTEFSTKTDLSSRRRAAKTTIGAQIMDIGKLPPQAVDLEEAVLGAMMLEKDVILQIIDILKPASFYNDAHARIFKAILELNNTSEPVDILTVTQALKKTSELEIVGGAFYITQLTNRVASAANAEFHARIIAQKFIQRELIRVSTDIIRESYEESSDIFELLDSAEKNLFSLVGDNIKKDVQHVSPILKKVINTLELREQQKIGLSGVPAGIQSLDRLTSGWQRTDLVIVAARPAMGKTALALTMARNAAVEFKHPVALFSLEMSAEQLVTRMMLAEAKVNSSDIKYLSMDNKLTHGQWLKINDALGVISNAKIYIDDTPSLSIFQLRAKARRLVEKQKVELIVVDYLQLMTATGDVKGNREQEISFISRSLKGLAKELNVPVIALSQLSRAVETRGGNKRPILSDLRESGAIEQDADMVMFIHRPEYYGDLDDGHGNSTVGGAELIIAKHRNGPVATAMARYHHKYTTFTDVDNDFEPNSNTLGEASGTFFNQEDNEQPF